MVLLSLPPKGSENKLLQELYQPEYNFWEQFNVEWTPWVQMVDYFDAVNDLKLDIMLIPRKDNYFNRCKSNLKFLEAGMLEIPVVAQSFSDGKSPYDKDINGENGLLALTSKDWEKQTMKLIEDKELRRIMGKKAKEYVLKNFNILNKKDNWKQIYNSLI
jgi:glycosyltransferase involved in cell wall biosynthesis